jgi:hypothetical protein
MAELTTKGHVEAAFVRTMKAIEGDYNPKDLYSYSGEGPEYRPIPGRYALDNAQTYGGVCIVRCTPPYHGNEGCGETQVTRRMKYGEFVEAVRFMNELLWSAGKGEN